MTLRRSIWQSGGVSSWHRNGRPTSGWDGSSGSSPISRPPSSVCHPSRWTRASGTRSNGSSRRSIWIGARCRSSKTVIWSTAMIGLALIRSQSGFRQGPGLRPRALPVDSREDPGGRACPVLQRRRMPDVRDRESYRRFGTKSTVIVPLSVAGQPLGALAFAAVSAERSWPQATVDRLQLSYARFHLLKSLETLKT